jgi:2-phospho-L-lactate guanylyltransferase
MVCALVAVKALALAKTRLATLLSPAERRALALAMLEDVLHALASASVVEHSLVVSRDPAVLQLAQSIGAGSYSEAAPDLNSALGRAALWCAQAGAGAVLAIHADLPLVTSQEITQLVVPLGQGYDVSLAPARDGGTNALAFQTATPMPFVFGGRSLARFQAVAQARALSARLVRAPGLERDIDRPEDLLWLLDEAGETRAHAVVRALGVIERAASV